jgi:Protein of unknown function (DUF1275)
MLALTLVTGLVDAFSYVILGHAFVANMIGNVVLLGFALAGAPAFSILASAAAIASFGPHPDAHRAATRSQRGRGGHRCCRRRRPGRALRRHNRMHCPARHPHC